MFGKAAAQEPDLQYFTLFDTKTGSYKDPMMAINELAMVREIESLFRDPKYLQNQLVTNSEDFQLFRIGSYTRKTGLITGHAPEHIANLHDIRSRMMRAIPLRSDAPAKGSFKQTAQGEIPLSDKDWENR